MITILEIDLVQLVELENWKHFVATYCERSSLFYHPDGICTTGSHLQLSPYF